MKWKNIDIGASCYFITGTFKRINRTMRLFMILLTLTAIVSGTVSAGTYKVKSQPQGEPVCVVKSLPDGGQIEFFKQTKVEIKDQTSYGFRGEGEWNYDTYLLTASVTPGQPKEVFWQHENFYPALQAYVTPEDARILDVIKEKDKAIVFFVSAGSVLFEHWKRGEDGTWSRETLGLIPLGEHKTMGRSIAKGQILNDQLVQLDFENGDMEKWSFADSSVAKLIDHNDLKFKYDTSRVE